MRDTPTEKPLLLLSKGCVSAVDKLSDLWLESKALQTDTTSSYTHKYTVASLPKIRSLKQFALRGPTRLSSLALVLQDSHGDITALVLHQNGMKPQGEACGVRDWPVRPSYHPLCRVSG